MIAAGCSAIAVLFVAAALRPRPAARRPSELTPARPRRRAPALPTGIGRRATTIDPGEVAAWCEGLARVVRSGSSLVTALRSVDPPASCRSIADEIVLSLERGRRLVDALPASTPSPHLNLAVTVLRACATNGGPPAEPLDRAASALRSRAADAAERRTQSAQARLSAVVMTVLPIAMLALLLATSSTTRSAALEPAGIATIAVGGSLNLIGWRWMRRIVGQVAS
jgi:tight adherence protein B